MNNNIESFFQKNIGIEVYVEPRIFISLYHISDRNQWILQVLRVTISIRSQCSINRPGSVLLAFGFIYAKTCMLDLRSISDLTAVPVLIFLLLAMPLMWTSVGFIHHSRSLVQEIFPDRVKDLNHHCVFEYFG